MGAMSNSSILRPSVRRRYLLRKEREEQRERERRRDNNQEDDPSAQAQDGERRRPTSLRERSESLERLRQVLSDMSSVLPKCKGPGKGDGMPVVVFYYQGCSRNLS